MELKLEFIVPLISIPDQMRIGFNHWRKNLGGELAKLSVKRKESILDAQELYQGIQSP